MSLNNKESFKRHEADNHQFVHHLSRSSKNINLYLLLFALFIIVFTLLFSWYSWEETKSREKMHLSSIARLGARSINAYFLSYQNDLNMLSQQVYQSGSPLDRDKARYMLDLYQQRHSELVNVMLSDRQGNVVVASTGVESRFGIPAKAFQAQNSFLVSRPRQEPGKPAWFIPLSQAIGDPQGPVLYVLTICLPLSQQQKFWRDSSLPGNAGIGLLSDQLYMISRYPIPEGANALKIYSAPRSGLVATHLKHNRFPEQQQGQGYNSVTGFDSLFAYNRLASFPLTLFVNIPVDGVFQRWLQQTRPYFILLAIFLAVASFVAVFIKKRQLALEQEHAHTDHLLQLSERRFSLAMRGTNDGLWDWDLTTDKFYFSPRWKNMLGFEEDEIEHHFNAWTQLVHPEDRGRLLAQVDDYMLGQRNSFEIKIRMCHKQGGWVHILSRAFLIRDDKTHEPLRLIGTHVDITEHYRVELRERQRNRVMEQLFQGVSIEQILTSVIESISLENPDLLCSIQLMNKDGKSLSVGMVSNLPEAFAQSVKGFELQVTGGGMSCGEAAYLKQRVITEDIQSHLGWQDYKTALESAGLAACWSEPVMNPAGVVLGTVALFCKNARRPNDGDLFLLELAGQLTALTIDQGRITEELQQAAMVYQNSKEAMVVSDEEGVIISVNPAFTQLTGYRQEDIIGKTHGILKSNIHDEAFYKEFYDTLNKSGQWQGEMWNRRKGGEIYVERKTITAIFNSDGTVHRHISLSFDITEKKQNEELVWQHANFDNLTDLPNRRMFYERLDWEIKAAQRSGTPLALMFIDLDRFKEVNDSLGHSMGDELLHQVANRILSCVRESDMVARIGGDEFTVLVGGINDHTQTEPIIEKVINKISKPFYLDANQIYISASIGTTFFPKDASSVESLLKNADHAMYEAKRLGRNRNCYFTPSMQAAVDHRRQLTQDLQVALLENQFEVMYQPIVNLQTGQANKAEALIRWHHPKQGLIEPGAFIHFTEETGLIREIGDWVFEQVTSQVARWKLQYNKNLQVSINLSPVQFQSRGNEIAGWVDKIRQRGLGGEQIMVEITEGLLLETSYDVTEQLKTLREAGIKVSLDDFGTGYSSLAYLKKFEIDYLKIDQTFVRNLCAASDDLALCEAMIVMAHKLGIKVVVEGVETDEQKRLLQLAGSDYAQGFLFSRPVSAGYFEKQYLC